MTNYDAVVVGGGVSGLVAAWRLHDAGRSVLVVEEKPWIGGNIHTYRDNGHLLERGPHSFLGSHDNVWRLIEDLGIESSVQPASAAADNRFVYRDGKIHAIPLGPMQFIKTPLLSFSAKMRLVSEPFRKGGAHAHDTALDFFLRRFGEEATTYLAGTFVSGIYAGNPAQIGARASFPKFWGFENEQGSMILGALKYMREKKKARGGKPARKGLFSFKEGLGFMSAELARRVGESSVRLSEGARVVRPGDGGWIVETERETYAGRAVILAAPPQTAKDLLAGVDEEMGRILAAIPMAPVALVHLGGKWTSGLPVGFGALVPRHYGIRTLGTVFVSQLFPGRAPEGRFVNTSFLGGTLDPGAVDLPDDDLVRIAGADQEKLLGITNLDYHNILRFAYAIPQLLPDHPERVERLRHLVAMKHGLFLAGNYLTGVGVDHAVMSGYYSARLANAYLK